MRRKFVWVPPAPPLSLNTVDESGVILICDFFPSYDECWKVDLIAGKWRLKVKFDAFWEGIFLSVDVK